MIDVGLELEEARVEDGHAGGALRVARGIGGVDVRFPSTVLGLDGAEEVPLHGLGRLEVRIRRLEVERVGQRGVHLLVVNEVLDAPALEFVEGDGDAKSCAGGDVVADGLGVGSSQALVEVHPVGAGAVELRADAA